MSLLTDLAEKAIVAANKAANAEWKTLDEEQTVIGEHIRTWEEFNSVMDPRVFLEEIRIARNEAADATLRKVFR